MKKTIVKKRQVYLPVLRYILALSLLCTLAVIGSNRNIKSKKSIGKKGF